MVIEKIEVDFDADEGYLRVDCPDEEFAQIRDFVVARAPASDRINLLRDGIRSIAVRRRPVPEAATPRPSGQRLRTALVAMVLAISLAIQVIGVVEVVRWLFGFGP